jgi:hypothetical protein
MNEQGDNISSILVGENLTEVDFVMDYLRLRFEDCFLTIIADAEVKTDAGNFIQNSHEFCFELIKCNGRKVEDAYIRKGECLRVVFDNGFELFVSLRREAYVKESNSLAEAITLNHEDGRMWVW